MILKHKDMPTEGQFVAVYEYNGYIWSGTYRYDEDGLIEEYSLDIDDFTPVGGSGDSATTPWGFNESVSDNVTFYTVEV